jgi:hypothetical protein
VLRSIWPRPSLTGSTIQRRPTMRTKWRCRFDVGANIRLNTLGDFAHHKANLKLSCRACDHIGIVSTERADRWIRCHGGNPHIDVLASYFRCSVCHGRPDSIRPVPMNTPLTFPEWMALESSWGRLVKRLRNR